MRFDASSFAIAGAIASLVPIVIHLVNRRQYKTVNWGAMAFLREAMERNRRVLHLRDMLLLTVRMTAVLLFGFLLSRSFIRRGSVESLWQIGLLLASLSGTIGFGVAWATSKSGRSKTSAVAAIASLIAAGFIVSAIARQSSAESVVASSPHFPVHAVLLIDNSRSMGAESAGGTLFDRARATAATFISKLPLGSRVTVIPLAGSEEVTTLDAYRSKIDAQRALDRLRLVDTEGHLPTGFEQARQASEQTKEPSEKRFVLITDAQANAWQGMSQADLKRLADWQIVNVTKSPARNVWVSHFRIEDGVAGTESPCRFQLRLHTSPAISVGTQTADDSFDAQIELSIDGEEVASKSLILSAGQDREVDFTYQFEGSADPLQPRWAVASLTVRADRQSVDQLLSDNRQQITVPVVSSIPVVFIDQYGDRERIEQNLIGETHALRHLMVPRLRNQNFEQPLIHIAHLRPEQVSQECLRTARLVVIGGIEQPDDELVSLLHQYARQGGPLVILAGGMFNPEAWTEHAWRDGHGILPAPLEPHPLGQTPEEAREQLRPYFVAFSSIRDDRLLIEGEDPKTLSALFESTPFFKAIRVTLNSAVLEQLKISDTKRFTDEQYALERDSGQNPTSSPSSLVPASTNDAGSQEPKLEPAWWVWRSPLPQIDRTRSPEDLAMQSQPRILASFEENHEPFAVERRIGDGRVLLFTSGVSSNWNLLRSSGAMYLFHRMFFHLIDQTFPHRTFDAGPLIVVPVERRRHGIYSVTRPAGEREPISVEPVNASIVKAIIRRPLSAGIYGVRSESQEAPAHQSTTRLLEDISLAINGVESESDLSVIENRDLQQMFGDEDVRVLAYDEPIGLEGGTRNGFELSKGLGWCVLACLLFEMAILAWPKSSVNDK